MKQILFFSLLFILLACKVENDTTIANNKALPEAEFASFSTNENIPISKELINKIRNYDGDDSLRKTINIEVFKLLKDSIFDKEDQFFGTMNPMFINIDKDEEEELLCLFGNSPQHVAFLGVFDKKNGNWHNVFFEPFSHYYEGVNFRVHNNAAKEKLISIKILESRGTGIYEEAYYFFKLIDGQFKLCLRIISDKRIHGWGLYLNHEINSDFLVTNYADEINVEYLINYFPGAIFDFDVSWNSHPEIVLIDKSEYLNFIWNEEDKRYEPQYEEKYGLSELQHRALYKIGNDSLTVHAFWQDFEDIIQGKDSLKKEIVIAYLKEVEKNNKAHVPSGKFKKLGETENGLEYFGVE